MAVDLIFPVPTGIAGFVEWFQYINTLTNDLFGNAIVAAFFVITFVSMSRSNFGRNATEKVIMASSFVTLLVSFFFMIIDIVGIQTVFLATVATIFSALLVKESRGTL